MGKENKKTAEEKTKHALTNNLEDVIEEGTNNSLIKQDKKHRRKVIILSLIVVVLIAIVSVFFYVLNNPRLIFNTAINNMFSTLEETIENLQDSNFSYTGTINEDYIDKLSIFNDLTVSDDNVVSIISGIKEAFLDASNGEKIEGSKITIKVDGQDKKTNRVSLIMDETNSIDIKNKLINNLKNDTDFLTACRLLSDYDSDDIIEIIETLIPTENTEPLIMSIYTTGLTRDFVKLEISREINNISHVFNITKLSDSKYEYKIVTSNKSIDGNITYKNNEIIIEINEYEEEILINQGSITLQGQY